MLVKQADVKENNDLLKDGGGTFEHQEKKGMCSAQVDPCLCGAC